jgi:superfamily II DNA or RNA helicase
MTRDESQQKFVDLWISHNFKGGCAAVTSWGKTRTAIKCALQTNSPDVNVIVPTKELKKQWESSLSSWIVPNYKVYVVNTAAKLSLKCDMLIIDEAHSAGMADWFQLSWTNAEFNKLLWLSATPERKDDKHKKLFSIAPKLMSVTFQEALKEGWVSNYDMYNVGIELTASERILYNQIDDNLFKLYKEFALVESIQIQDVKKKAFKLANQYVKSGDWSKISIAKRYFKLIGDRRFLLYNAEEKINKTCNYILKNPDKKVLIFSQSQEFADKIQDKLGDICITIHSKLSNKNRELNLKRFLDNRTKIRVISSVKALNEGIDLPIVDVGICASGTSSKKDMTQMLGRVLRLYKDKHALFFNLYIRHSQDLYWLKNRQIDMDDSKIKWI